MKKLLTLAAVLVISLTACAQKAPKVIRLLEPSYNEGLTLMQALKERKSSQGFTEKEISLQDLSNILWASVGVNRPDGKRTAPTGSNRRAEAPRPCRMSMWDMCPRMSIWPARTPESAAAPAAVGTSRN